MFSYNYKDRLVKYEQAKQNGNEALKQFIEMESKLVQKNEKPASHLLNCAKLQLLSQEHEILMANDLLTL